MSTTPTTPTPSSSQYSSDLQQVLSRAIAIASLPLTQLNSQLTDSAEPVHGFEFPEREVLGASNGAASGFERGDLHVRAGVR